MNLLRFAVRRLLLTIPVLWVMTLFVFLSATYASALMMNLSR